MEDFSTYILHEEDHIQKMIITYYLSKKADIFFDKSVVLKTEITKIFIDYSKLNVDKNMTLTAMLLCNCKKIEDFQRLEKLETYAEKGAEYLGTLGFSKRFCKICEGVNRHSELEPREPESDVLELVDQFTEIMLNSQFTVDESLVILKDRNLKNIHNRYLNDFEIFLKEMNNINVKGNVNVPIIRKLISLCNTSKSIKSFISILGNEYDNKIDMAIEKAVEKQMKSEIINKNTKSKKYTRIKQKERAMFTKEITDKILNHESVYRIEEDE